MHFNFAIADDTKAARDAMNLAALDQKLDA
jgi:hypothetical protein